MIKCKFGLGLGERRLEQQSASPTISHISADSDSLVPHLPHPMFEIAPVLRVPTLPSVQRGDSRLRGPVDLANILDSQAGQVLYDDNGSNVIASATQGSFHIFPGEEHLSREQTVPMYYAA